MVKGTDESDMAVLWLCILMYHVTCEKNDERHSPWTALLMSLPVPSSCRQKTGIWNMGRKESL